GSDGQGPRLEHPVQARGTGQGSSGPARAGERPDLGLSPRRTARAVSGAEGNLSKSTFSAMAGPKAKGEAPRIGVGMMGYAFMGKAHSNEYKTQPYMMYPPVAIPDLVAICGRDVKAVQ